MQNYPEEPYRQKRSSRRLWLFLGVPLGILVISMGGCVACVALIGMSSLDGGELGGGPSGYESRGVGGGTPAVRGRAAAGTWTGSLDCSDGDSVPATVKVSEDGNPFYLYQTSAGAREEELTAVGQTFRFVPPGGGIYTATVDSLSVSEDGFSFSTRTSTTRAGGRTLTQGGGRVSYKAVLVGRELEAEVVSSSSMTASQPGIVIPGDESTTVCRGRLQRE